MKSSKIRPTAAFGYKGSRDTRIEIPDGTPHAMSAQGTNLQAVYGGAYVIVADSATATHKNAPVPTNIVRVDNARWRAPKRPTDHVVRHGGRAKSSGWLPAYAR